ncbi:unnamed protein product, partial [Polarella glacialis]
ETPLMEAACGGDESLCKLLLSYGADPTRLSAGGKLARDFVPAEARRPELLKLLAPLPRVARDVASTSSPSRPAPPRLPPGPALASLDLSSKKALASEETVQLLQAALRTCAQAADVEELEALLGRGRPHPEATSALARVLRSQDAAGQSLLHLCAAARGQLPCRREAALRLLLQLMQLCEASSSGRKAPGVDLRNKIGETALVLAL